jgi:hypothetical protein
MLCYITRREFVAMAVALAIGTLYYVLRKVVPGRLQVRAEARDSS